jgi:hypothetical protein
MLYGWKIDAVPGLTLPPFAGIGPHVFLFTTALAMIAEAGFIRLSRDIKRKQAKKSKGAWGQRALFARKLMFNRFLFWGYV